MKKTATFILCIILTSMLFAGCGGKEKGTIPESPFAGRDTVDLSGYDSMSGHDGGSRFVDTTVAEIDRMMSDGESFIFFAAFEDCSYCDQMMPYLNDALAEADTYAGYLDTRKDSDWMNNADIDDYDLFVKRFGKYLESDSSGSPHLYTPDLYVIKNGKVKAHHQGVLESADDPDQPLSSSQEEELRELLEEMIDVLK
ncbi:MAG: hypothetical protein IKE74_03675 [Mogibacterium sp.]|nr:hypothetical protein [Mogibacterium sp.]